MHELEARPKYRPGMDALFGTGWRPRQPFRRGEPFDPDTLPHRGQLIPGGCSPLATAPLPPARRGDGGARRRKPQDETSTTAARICAWLYAHPGTEPAAIARGLALASGTVVQHLQRMLADGDVEQMTVRVHVRGSARQGSTWRARRPYPSGGHAARVMAALAEGDARSLADIARQVERSEHIVKRVLHGLAKAQQVERAGKGRCPVKGTLVGLWQAVTA